ncbi:hypothetical protein HS7_14970 [Sulfolobales archaeon HS-7]|nr:hypothetical protein HS7_14970 [Sulfolobales archaeon HS-7]
MRDNEDGVDNKRRQFIKDTCLSLAGLAAAGTLETLLTRRVLAQSLCSPCSWQYGMMSPTPPKRNFGGFIRVKMPPTLPSDLPCLYVIWSSLSTTTGYFYQTSLGYHPSWGWHVSAGSTNPILACGLACGPFGVNNGLFRPQPNNIYELGIRFIPNGGTNDVYLYVVDWETNDIYNIFKLTDSGVPNTPIGGVLESYSIGEQELESLGGTNSFEVVNANWLLKPWESETWSHGYVYGPTQQTCTLTETGYQGYEGTPSQITMLPLGAGRIKIGYQAGGKQYASGYQLW